MLPGPLAVSSLPVHFLSFRRLLYCMQMRGYSDGHCTAETACLQEKETLLGPSTFDET